MRTTNTNCRKFVQGKKTFTAHQLYSETHGATYVVYSYGPHWPLFACIDDVWYENSDKFSKTTSKQRGQAHPRCETIKLTCDELKRKVK